MRFALCFLAIVCGASTLPAEVPLQAPDELDLSKLVPKNIYVEPIVPAENHDVPGSRIIGGSEMARNSIPYQAAVIIDGNSLCGGSLISPSRVLTAAHCTFRASFAQVILGAHYFNEQEDTQVRVTSASITNHNFYNEITLINDISVIFLLSPVDLNDNIKVLPLAPTNAGNFEEATGLLTGWGRTTDSSNDASPSLRGVYVEVMANTPCTAAYGSIVTSQNLCTLGTGTVGGCTGDSGGPLVYDGVQIGLVSFSATMCEGAFPTVYTRISTFRSWILENAGV